ncbi:MAG TPA: response regulator, partial [Chthoniobacteraceae bacterium]|nr:response regulator [Chthoniobacteraceae bacterium]
AGKIYEVREVNDPVAATRVAREFRPDAVLLDVDMPLLDGGDVRSLFKEDPELAKIPVLFVTASILQEEVESFNGRIAGEVFIAKPVTIDTLKQSIEESIEAAGSGVSL